ncbi:MAG TPA: efflux RND transporter periplasmic adaptor subunit [Candidatus Methylacidiphilales bacterium]
MRAPSSLVSFFKVCPAAVPPTGPFKRMALMFLFALALSACQPQQPTAPQADDPLVPVVPVQSAPAPSRTFTGVVMARVESDLGFRVPGKVVVRLVDTGVFVKAGQPLMRLDQTDFLHEITNQEGAVAAAKAHAIQTAADLERYRGLRASGAVSSLDFDHAKADDDSAQSLLAAAEAKAQVARDDGQYTELCADADGVVAETLAEPGQVVTAGQTVVKLAHSGPREASVNLPETIRPALGSVAQAVLYDGGSKTFPARLRQLSDAADPLTRTFEARYVMDGDGAQAPLGATVTVTIDQTGGDPHVAVPLGALDDEGNGPGVWVFDGSTSKVTYRLVQVGALSDEIAEISNGLHLGDQVVAMGGHYLHQDQRVRVAEIKAAMQ